EAVTCKTGGAPDAVRQVVLVSAVRTPVGKFMGALAEVPAHVLGAQCIREVLRRANDLSPADVDEVVLGQVLTSGAGQNPARQAAKLAGIPVEVPAHLVNMLCGSSLRAVVTACQAIQCGSSDLVVAGGQESMSLAPHLLHMRRPVKFGDRTAQDSLMCDGLTDAFSSKHMGVTAENVARRYGVSRQDQDNFACLSQNKAEKAQRSDLFKEELLPAAASAVGSDQQEPLLRQDEFPRHGTTVEGLKSLKPSFQKDAEATVTAGNSSGINDGAAALLLASAEEAAKRGLPIMARVVSYGQAGVEPDYMGMGPVPAIRKALSRAGWSTKDVDLFELNEAFAAQAVAVCSELDLDRARLNVCGGAIALGHPIGCSGARILVTLAHQMRRLSARRGCAAACIGGGMGIAVCLELPSSSD
ncbi:hypothetical protein BOX15_Mlig022505g1, partial [Macrostomum lignano]